MAPPSQLLRAILRAHRRHLPAELRSLGDVYVKAEFRLHRTATPEQAQQFLAEWRQYLEQIATTARAQESVRAGAVENQIFEFGKDLPHDVELSEDQLRQLDKMRDEAAKARRGR